MKRRRKKRGRKGHYHTGTYTSPKCAGECRYRSGWELKYMEYLDASDDVASFLYEGVQIPYLSNVKTGKVRRYLPDFLVTYVDGSRRMVEVKPSRRVHQQKVLKKLCAAGDWCRANNVTFVVVTEVELKALGLLTRAAKPST